MLKIFVALGFFLSLFHSKTQLKNKIYRTKDLINLLEPNQSEINKKLPIYQKIINKIFNPIGKYEYNYEIQTTKNNNNLFNNMNEFNKINKSHNFFIFNNFSLSNFIYKSYKLYKIHKFSPVNIQYEETIVKKSIKNKIINLINNYYNNQIHIYQKKILANNTRINNIFLNKGDPIKKLKGKKGILKSKNEYDNFLNNLEINKLQKNIYNINFQPQKFFLSIKFKSYKYIIEEKEKKMITNPILKFFNVFTINFCYNISPNNDDFEYKKKWIFAINITNILECISQLIKISDYKSKHILIQQTSNIHKYKCYLQKKSYKNYQKTYEKIYNYRKKIIKIMDGCNYILKKKYGDNIYSKEYFYKMLNISENLKINLLRFEQNNKIYQWGLFLENPKSTLSIQ